MSGIDDDAAGYDPRDTLETVDHDCGPDCPGYSCPEYDGPSDAAGLRARPDRDQPDELAEAEAYAREKAAKNWRAPSLIGNVAVALLAEIDRLRRVELAAALLVEHWDPEDGLCCNKHATPALQALADALNGEAP